MSMDAERLAKTFGSVVRAHRKAQGYSQEGFADHCGFHRTYGGAIERGESVPTLATGMKIAAGLGLPFHKLMQKVERELAKDKPTS